MNQSALRAAAQQRAIAPVPIGGYVRAQENAARGKPVADRHCSPRRARLRRGQRQNYLTAHWLTRVDGNLAALQRARARGKEQSCAPCREMM